MSISRLLAATMIAGAPADSDGGATGSPANQNRGLDEKSRPTTGPAHAMAPAVIRGSA
ncbi:MAG: hypothetical protein ACYDHT_03630 [Solirubrobacteraceae bacterium]